MAAACRNFAAAGAGADAARFLLLTESAGANAFADLKTASVPGFRREAAPEPETIVYREDASGMIMHLVAGRQIVTAERLEILALGCAEEFPDGVPAREVLSRLAANPARLAVLPWGAGKWLGKRGEIAAELVREAWPGALFLGDNGNRPFFWPLPALFAEAESRGVRNLPGSDPLPFPGQENKIGGFGVSLAGDIDPARPFASLRALLADPATPLVPYGRNEGLFPFFKNQIAMQLRKKSRRPERAS